MNRCFFALSALALIFAIGCSHQSESPNPSSSAEASAPSGPSYNLEVKAPGTAKVGQEATTEVIVTPGQGFKINLEYPAKLQLGTLPEGATVAAQTVTKGLMNIEKARLVAPVRFTATKAGEQRFQGELRFSVCNDKTCQMPREQISWTTDVTEAAAP